MKNKVIVALVSIALVAGVVYAFTWTPPDVVAERDKTQTLVEGVQETAQESRRVDQEHKIQTIREVVTIREKIYAEARAMPPDALLAGVLDELDLFGRSAGSADIAGASGISNY